MLLRPYLLGAALASASLATWATSPVDTFTDSLVASHKIITIPGSEPIAHPDSVRNLIEQFYVDQFRSFQDPAAPYFLFMSRDAKLAMGIGGCVRMRGWYDWGGAIPANGFVPALIQMTPNPTNERKLGTTPAGTALFFRVIGHTYSNLNYQLYIETNFNGYESRDLHLKKAYAIINDWTIGYASSTFSDPAAQPPTVDAQGPNNKLGATDVLVRWMKPFGKHFTLALSAENPAKQTQATDEFAAKCSEWMPDVAMFVQWGWRRSEHARLSAIYRTLSYRNLATEKNHNLGALGLMASAVTRPVDPLTIYSTFTAGKGVASLGGDMMVAMTDLVMDPHAKGRMYAPWGLGWCLGLQWNFRPNLFACVSASQTYNKQSYTHMADFDRSNFRRGSYIAANVFWNLTPRAQVGAEFNLGERTDVDSQRRWARRIGALCQFSF